MDPRAGRRVRRGARQFFAESGERLVAFAAHQFWLDRPLKDGSTHRQHLESAAECLLDAPVELEGPECPPELAHVWAWFCELAQCRRSNGFGVEAIGHGDIVSWSQLTGVKPTPLEVDCIRALDRAYFDARDKK